MKKLIKLSLNIMIIVSLIFTSLVPVIANDVNSSIRIGNVLPTDLIKPAQITNVKYVYQNTVKKVDLSKYVKQDGMLKAPAGVVIKPGTVLVDEINKTALYVSLVKADGSILARIPTMDEVFEDFEIPQQTITYNQANIIDLQPAIKNARAGISTGGIGGVVISNTALNSAIASVLSSSKTPTTKVTSLSSQSEKDIVLAALKDGIEYSFDATPLDAYLEDGTKISVKMSGKVAFNMEFDTKYTKFSGYRFGINGAQMLGLKAVIDVKANKEVYIPIVGIDLPFAVGALRAGIFLVVGVNGDISIVISGEEGMSFKAGIKGGTAFCIPTSFDTYSERHSYYSAECDPNGQITAYAYITPTVTLEALGIDVVKAEIRLGFKAYSVKNDLMLNYGVNAVAQFYIAVLGEGTHIFNVDYPLFSRQKEAPPGGYYFYSELCAYRDDVLGAVYKVKKAGEALPADMDPFADKLPYAGPIQIYFYRGNNTTQPYKVIDTTINIEDKGLLRYNFGTSLPNGGIDVLKGDSIRIAVPNNNEAISKNVFSTIPFKGIRLDNVDFFNEIAIGQVQPASAIRDMPGWANTVVQSDTLNQLIYCQNRSASVKLIDPQNKILPVTLSATTDSQGKFKISNYDIRPYNKATPFINIDGFEIEGMPLESSCGISFVMATDNRFDYKGKVLAKNADGTASSVLTLNTMEELRDTVYPIISLEFTSGDHFIAINKNGTKKITNTIDYTTNAYFVQDMEALVKLALCVAASGATVDLRNMIMSRDKLLVYNDHATLAINEANNSQIRSFGGTLDNSLSGIQKEVNAASSSHAYHRAIVKDANYTSYFDNSAAVTRPLIIPGRLTQNILRGAAVTVYKENYSDISDLQQPKGLDMALTQSNIFLKDALYVDTKAILDIEGFKVTAVQSDPWIYKGEKATYGVDAQQKVKNEIQRAIKEGVTYLKRRVINPNYFTNTKASTWKPAANTVRHEVTMDLLKGTMYLDGIPVKADVQGKAADGKLYLPIGTIVKMMGGTVKLDSKSNSLSLAAGGKSILLNTNTRSAVVNGKSVTIANGLLGTGTNTLISAEAMGSLLNVSVKSDMSKQSVKISFSGY